MKINNLISDNYSEVTNISYNNFKGTWLDSAINKVYSKMLDGVIVKNTELSIDTIYRFSKLNNDREKSNKTKLPNVDHIAQRASTKKLKIVVAEDDPTSNYLLSIFLRQKLHHVIQVKNGQEAIDTCKSDHEIDLILMDIRMPIRDGHSATKEIRDFNKKIIIIAQTAFGNPSDKEKALSFGFNDYLSKPIDKDKLFEMIDLYFPQ